MGTSEHVMNHWKSPIPFGHGHAACTLTAGEVESTCKAKVDRPPKELMIGRSSESIGRVLKQIKKTFLHEVLTSKTYSRFFKHLLWIEEIKME